MILRELRWRRPCAPFLLSALLVAAFVHQCEAQKAGGGRSEAARKASSNSPQSVCQDETFLCPKEQTCLPKDWLLDGEPDCEDGADEGEMARTFMGNSTGNTHTGSRNDSGSKAKGPNSSDKKAPTRSSGSTSSAKHPNSSSSTTSTTTTSPATTSTTTAPALPPQTEELPQPANEETDENANACSPEQRRDFEQCSAEMLKWSAGLVSAVISLANSSESPSILRDREILVKIEKGCQISECMHGLPPSCEGNKFGELHHDWFKAQMYLCELVVPSLKEHVDCFIAQRRPQCQQAKRPARDSLFCSLLTTTVSDLNCIEQFHGDECGEVAVELFTPLMSETKHVLEEMNCSLGMAQPKGQIATMQTTAEEAEEPPTTPDVVTPRLPVASSPPSSSKNDLSSALFAFGNVDTICDGKAVVPADIWAPVRSKLCSRREEIRQHSECYLDALKQNRCPPNKLTKITSCGAIEAFNQNVDCAIKLLNDACPVETQDLVVDVQEKLNDLTIEHKCFEQVAASNASSTINSDGFTLLPTRARCNSDQENAALICLVELVEITKQMSRFNTNFLLEISDPNSTITGQICDLYGRYERCLANSVFNDKRGEGKRCAFNSPLNTLARIGLEPICNKVSRDLLFQSRECLMEVSRHPESVQCQSSLQHLGHAVNLMLQGIHGEALLCKSFYIFRSTFDCGEKIVKERCNPQSIANLKQIKEKMAALGLEEGCPAEAPKNLDEIIARPVATTKAPPKARPIPVPSPAVGNGSSPVVIPAICEPEEQKRFGACVQPLTAFQPHPLAVIKQPKQIDEACEAFKAFTACRASVKCNPLWARGMSAMFEYACGDGYEKYGRIRQCIRRTTTRGDIRECVMVFSKGAPQEACQSSNKLLTCALPPINEKCGAEAVDFVQEYVRRFATVIDPQCRVEEEPAAKAVMTFNCSANEDQIVQHCSAPLNDIHGRLDELFEGGLQSFLKNVNNLAPVFAEGCNLTKEFRECAKPVLQNGKSGCVVSSCMMQAGRGICDQPDVAQAIESNLGCVFKQVSDTNFGKCLRSTIATIKQLNLAALREVLPKFVACVEPIVLKSCGPVPVNVLKALSSKNMCPVTSDETPIFIAAPIVPVTADPSLQCTAEKAAVYEHCSKPFYAKYEFVPGSLISNRSVGVDEVCGDAENLAKCVENTDICEPAGRARALRKMISRLCTTKSAFAQRRECLNSIITSEKGSNCLRSHYSPTAEDYCKSLNNTMECLSESIFTGCPPASVSFVYEYTNEYLKDLMPTIASCQLSAPSVALETGCSEQDLIQHLQCETRVDRFKVQPISILGNGSIVEFCSVVESTYRPCLEALPCRFEPVTSASLELYENVCKWEITNRDQIRFGPCLSEYSASKQGADCLEPFTAIDMLSRDVGRKICDAVDQILKCSSDEIEKKCGDEALLHVYDLHNRWMHSFNKSCSLSPPATTHKEEPVNTERSQTEGEQKMPTTTMKMPTKDTVTKPEGTETEEEPKATGDESEQNEMALSENVPFTQASQPTTHPMETEETPVTNAPTTTTTTPVMTKEVPDATPSTAKPSMTTADAKRPKGNGSTRQLPDWGLLIIGLLLLWRRLEVL